MNFAMFSVFGYASVLLWLAALGLVCVHFMRHPRRWLCHVAVLFVPVALGLATINSRTYVNRLQVDQSDAIAAAQAQQEKARRLAEAERADDVAQIRFAEDDRTDFLDMGGLDETDRKYIESIDETIAPAWKQQKRQRSAVPAVDDSLEGQLDTTEKAAGVDVSSLEKRGMKLVVLPEKIVMLANRLDALNLSIIRWLLLAGLIVVVFDYLQRINRDDEAYLPLPLPSALVNNLTPLPVVYTIPPPLQRTRVEELERLVRRGDTFIFLTKDTAAAAAVPEKMPRLPFKKCLFDVLHVQADDPLVTDEFIFDGLWYNRAAFVIDSATRAESFLTVLCEQLVERYQTRARVRQTVHIVWALDVPMAEILDADSIRLAGSAGICLREITKSEPK